MTIYETPSEQFRPGCLPSEQSQIFSMICVAKTTRNINYLDPSELRITERGNHNSFQRRGIYKCSQWKEVKHIKHLSFDNLTMILLFQIDVLIFVFDC